MIFHVAFPALEPNYKFVRSPLKLFLNVTLIYTLNKLLISAKIVI